MKRNLWAILLVCASLALVGVDADAKRMGGGKSFGRQSSNVTQREAGTTAAPGSPAQNAAPAAAAPAATAAAAQAPRRPWAGMLGGLAAGLGLAWLANALGLGAAFSQFLLIALLVLAGFVLWRLFSSRNRPQAGTGRLALQGAGLSARTATSDASVRPLGRQIATSFDGGGALVGGGNGVSIGSALVGAQGWGVPVGFDVEGFLTAAKRNFVTLQGAWDRADIGTLRSMMTDRMVDDIQLQLKEREQILGGQPNTTDVQMLEAKLLGVEELPDVYLASVEFSGLISEESSVGATPFREVWNMSKPQRGGGWLVAGVQALQ